MFRLQIAAKECAAGEQMNVDIGGKYKWKHCITYYLVSSGAVLRQQQAMYVLPES